MMPETMTRRHGRTEEVAVGRRRPQSGDGGLVRQRGGVNLARRAARWPVVKTGGKGGCSHGRSRWDPSEKMSDRGKKWPEVAEGGWRRLWRPWTGKRTGRCLEGRKAEDGRASHFWAAAVRDLQVNPQARVVPGTVARLPARSIKPVMGVGTLEGSAGEGEPEEVPQGIPVPEKMGKSASSSGVGRSSRARRRGSPRLVTGRAGVVDRGAEEGGDRRFRPEETGGGAVLGGRRLPAWVWAGGEVAAAVDGSLGEREMGAKGFCEQWWFGGKTKTGRGGVLGASLCILKGY